MKTTFGRFSALVDRRSESLASGVALAAVLTAGLIILLSPILPLQDYQEWMYQGWLLKELALGDRAVLTVAQLSHVPVPNATMQLCLAGLNFVVDPLTAGRIFALLYLGTGYAIVLLMTRRASPAVRGSLRVILVLSLLLSSRFWNGYLAYQLGLWLLAWFLLRAQGFAERAKTSLPAVASIALVGVVIFFTHIIAYGGFLLVLTFMAFHSHVRRVILAGLPSGLLALWYGLGVSKMAHETHMPAVQWILHLVQYKAYTVGKWGPFVNFYAGPRDSGLAAAASLYWAGVALNFVFGAGLVGLIAWALLRHQALLRQHAPIAASTSAVCLIAFAVVPSADMILGVVNDLRIGVVNLGERILGISLIAGILVLTEVGSRFVKPIRFLAMLAAVGSFYLMVPAFFLHPTTSQVEIKDIVSDYYTDQRYFSTRPYWFGSPIDSLRSGTASNELPELLFQSSLLIPRIPRDSDR